MEAKFDINIPMFEILPCWILIFYVLLIVVIKHNGPLIIKMFLSDKMIS